MYEKIGKLPFEKCVLENYVSRVVSFNHFRNRELSKEREKSREEIERIEKKTKRRKSREREKSSSHHHKEKSKWHKNPSKNK